MRKQILYCSNNKAKIWEVASVLKPNGIKVVSPKDLGIEEAVEEKGDTLKENARLKVEAYTTNLVQMGDDTAFEIDALDGEPGIYVRRWLDKNGYLSDEELIALTLQKMKNVPEAKRGAQLRTVIALKDSLGKIEYFEGVLRGRVALDAKAPAIKGYPFGPLLFIDEWKMMLDDVLIMPENKRVKYLTQRGKAVEKTKSRLKELLK